MARILIVDDDPVSRRFLREALVPAHHDADEAEDGIVALRLARERRYDAIVSDLRLPRLDGETWLGELRREADAASRDTRALLLSAEMRGALRERLERAGFVYLAEKPVDIDVLLAFVDGDDVRREPRDGATDAALRRTSSHEPARRFRVAESSMPPRADAPPGEVDALDDAAGLAASGSLDVLLGLRELFAGELPPRLDELAAAVARGDAPTVREIVHRLRAACRFCGALELDACLEHLHREAATDRAAREAWPAVRRCADRTIAALRARAIQAARD